MRKRDPQLSYDSQTESEIQEAYVYAGACTQKVIIQKRTGEKETHLSITSRLEAQVFTGK